MESPQTESKDPSPVHTATGAESAARSHTKGKADAANTPTSGSAEPANTPATGDVESNTTHVEAATDATTVEPTADPSGSGQEDASASATPSESRMEKARSPLKEAASGV